MQNSEDLLKNDSIKLTTQQSLRRLSFCSQISTVQQSSPVVFPEKRNKGKTFSISINNDDTNKEQTENHRIDIGDEQSDLLGDEVFSGKLSLSKNSESTSQNFVDAKLTSKALIWGPKILHLKDVVSLSYCFGLRHFTVHSYQFKKASCGFSCFIKAVKVRKDYRFLASNTEEAIQWVSSFADQQFYVNFLSHPLNSKKKQSSEFINNETPHEVYIRCKNPPRVLVILNPRSGSGRSSKVFHDKVEPIFKLAGFEIEVVKTTSAGHARKLASTVDFSTCPDGIICVGGDGIVNEVLNGLLSRDNQKEGISVPIGIIPAGSDNSLVYTVLGVTDPISAAISIVKGGLTAIDVFAVEWIHTGAIHFGMIVTYFGFVSDVLELSERYQKRFGPLRYLVAGFFKFLCLPKYTFEVEYLPSIKESTNEGKITDQEEINMSELYTDIMRRSQREGLPRASSLSSIDSIITPSRISDIDNNNTEPSEYVRAIDSKSKRLSLTRNNNSNSETEVVHSQQTRNYVRTRSKSRTDKIWTGLTVSSLHDKEDISSTMSDPGGHVWETEPRWDSDESKTEKTVTEIEEKWVKTKGRFLGVLVCNHACKTVQNQSQILAPKAEHDDNNMDLLLVHGSGRIKLLRFLIHLQKGSHVSLPYVEYVKVKSVKVKLGKHSHNGCGIDGELFPVNGQVVSSLLPEQCRLIGRLSNNI